MSPYFIECDGHGAKPWDGECICVRCKAVQTMNFESAEQKCIGCKCDFFKTARPICPECFKAKTLEN